MHRSDLSVIDIFKIGIGPSSSHTMGPWRAALDFVDRLYHNKKLSQVVSVQIELLGSLCKTGKGHGTDKGILMGLTGELPDQIDPKTIAEKIRNIIVSKSLTLALPLTNSNVPNATQTITFELAKDLMFQLNAEASPYLQKQTQGKLIHPNTMFLIARFKDGGEWMVGYHSIGGGFIERLEEVINLDNTETPVVIREQNRNFPYPIATPEDLLQYIIKTGLSIDEIVTANEHAWLGKEELDTLVKEVMYAMIASVYHGCHVSGVLAGGLKVNRRAQGVYEKILAQLPPEFNSRRKDYSPNPTTKELDEWIRFIADGYNYNVGTGDFKVVSKWVIAFALAVNEENAAYGKIVTAPTNGAAGVIPAVMLYHMCFSRHPVNFEEVKRFLLCASEIGSLFKKGSTISAAAGGCQAEIGVSSAMAAAGLTLVQGGSSRQVLAAAEIAMEHHLGLTCDPIQGLVQVPCIERNSMGAMKAITAAELALVSDPDKSVVQLQDVIKTMWNTAQDMSSKYKETSEGGLATTVGVNFSEC